MAEFPLEPYKTPSGPGPGPKGRLVKALKIMFLLGLGVIFLLPLGLFSASKLAGSSQLCIKCHEMKPEYVTWQASSHSQFACIDCHTEPGLLGAAKTQVKGMKILFRHLTQPNSAPIKMQNPVRNSVCTSCHSLNRNVTPSGDLLVPHDRHDRKGVACTECHSGVAHGNIVKRGVRAQVDLVDWTEAMGKKQMQPKYVIPPMDACLNCHSLRNVTTKCSICHSKVVIPDTHKAPTWLAEGQHGADAQKGIRECHKCHSYSYSGTYKPFGMGVREYIQNNEFCIDCHSFTRPPSHGKSQEEWLPVHYDRAYRKGLNNCLTCHIVDKPKVESKNTIKVYCNSCHWFSPINP